jgi:hypothetical protein
VEVTKRDFVDLRAGVYRNCSVEVARQVSGLSRKIQRNVLPRLILAFRAGKADAPLAACVRTARSTKGEGTPMKAGPPSLEVLCCVDRSLGVGSVRGRIEIGYATVDRYIARENIRHFRERLCVETDSGLRSRLLSLLIEEENKLGADLELLTDVERHISDGHHRIERQRAIIITMERDGHSDLAQARGLLECLIESQLLFKDYRQRILIEIDQNGL